MKTFSLSPFSYPACVFSSLGNVFIYIFSHYSNRSWEIAGVEEVVISYSCQKVNVVVEVTQNWSPEGNSKDDERSG